MRLTVGQVTTLALVNKRLGCEVPTHLIKPFLAKIERGVEPPQHFVKELQKILFAFRMIAYDYNLWVEDFSGGILFLCDFDNEDVYTRRLAAKAYRKSLKDNNMNFSQSSYLLNWESHLRHIVGVAQRQRRLS